MGRLSSLSEVLWQIQTLDPGSLTIYRVKFLTVALYCFSRKTVQSFPLTHGFTFRSFSNPWSRILHGKCWSFKLHIILSGVMESPAFQLRPPGP